MKKGRPAMTIAMKDIKTIKANLIQRRKDRLAIIDDCDLSIKEIILRLATELRRTKKRGVTTTEMIEALKENGINIKGATLNRYLAEYQATAQSANTDSIRKNLTTKKRTERDIVSDGAPPSQNTNAPRTSDKWPTDDRSSDEP
jgi:serine/threonine protein kinase HipA of HipAB toxin-antitoxin module